MPESVCVGNVKVCTSNKTAYNVGKHLKWSWNLLCNIVNAGYIHIIHSLPHINLEDWLIVSMKVEVAVCCVTGWEWSQVRFF